MFWPLREIAEDANGIAKELSVLSISDVTAWYFMGLIEGPYIGDDYYLFINKSSDPSRILVPEQRRRLERIRDMYTQGLDKDNHWRG